MSRNQQQGNVIMRKGNIPFRIFQQEIYDQLNRRKLNELFFWSLSKKGYSEGTDGEEMFATQFSLDTRRKIILSHLKKSKKSRRYVKINLFKKVCIHILQMKN